MWRLYLKLTTLILWLGAVSAQASGPTALGVHASDVSIIFDEDDVIVNPGKRLALQCGVEGQYRNCYWEKGSDQIFQVEDVHANLVAGMSAPEKLANNECGIVIESTSADDHGRWMCKIFVIGDALVKSKNVIVTMTPTKPKLEISNRPLTVNTENKQSILCSVAKARPKATISWYLDGEDITHSSRSESPLVDDKGVYKTVSTLTRQFQPKDNGKRLICSVKHYTLSEPLTDVVDVDVKFAPVPQEPITFYQIQTNTNYDISVNFSSNPPPQNLGWSFGDSYDNLDASIPIPGLDTEGRYTANAPVLLPNGDYSAVLRISQFTEQDALRKFQLTVENDLGRTDYQVMLSMDEPPRESLGAGAVAAIVIVSFLVVFVLLVAGYAKYNQMYCFAKKSDDPKKAAKDPKEEHSDTESARAPSANKGQVILKSINKNISSIKSRLSTKSKKSEESKMEEGSLDDKNKDKEVDLKTSDKSSPQTDEAAGGLCRVGPGEGGNQEN